VHTSTITVAVMSDVRKAAVAIDPDDLMWKTCRSGGKGGQHAQKNDTAVTLVHLPTGIRVRMETRSQLENKRLALEALGRRLAKREKDRAHKRRNRSRRDQVGSGMRGDKRRTIAVQRGDVTDHRTGRSTSYRRFKRGFVDDLHDG